MEDTNTRCDGVFDTWTTHKSPEARNQPENAFSSLTNNAMTATNIRG